MARQTAASMWPENCDRATEGVISEGCASHAEEAQVFEGFLVFVGMRLAMVTGAALLVYWQVVSPLTLDAAVE